MANRTVGVVLRAEVGQYVSSMARAAAATEGVGRSASTTTARAAKSFDIAGKGALLMGGAIATGIGAAIGKSMEFEKAMSAVGAATMATSGTMAQLRATAIKAGADTSFSATEAADGITEMAKAGVSAKDIMGGGLTGALSLAAAGQISVADAAGIASVAMTQFNLKGGEIPHVADLLAAGAGKAMGSVDDLGQALNQAGLVASSAGLNIEETTGTLAAFAAAGLVGSDSGTSLKTMLTALQGPSSKASDVMAEYGINMYDANGNMLDMAGMAGQLKDHLGGLTQEQRNSALATIFGSDAVRAANVLYSQGADGIAAWTSKVNDSGYASKQAAALQDNLSGDLEKLGGSFDTLMISLGSGAQGPLRDVVEMLTGVVNVGGDVIGFLNNLPGPVKAGVLAWAGFLLLRGPLDAMLTSLSVKVMSTVTGMGMAAAEAGVFRAAAGGMLTMLGGPLGLAIGAVSAALPLLVGWLGKSSETSQRAAEAQQSYAAALQSSNGAIDENVRKAAAKAAQDAGLLDVAQRLHIPLSQVTDAITTQGGALESTRAKLQAFIAEHSKPLATKYGVSTVLDDEGKSAQGTLDALNRLAGTTTTTATKQDQLALAAKGAGGSLADSAPKVDTYTQSLQNASKAASDAKTQTDLFKLSLDILTGKTVSLIQVESAFQEAVASATGATKGLHGSVTDATGGLNLHSEAGRKASGVLLNVRDTANTLISTMISQGATAAQVTAADARMRDGFIHSAMQMGISRVAAEKLANQILGIPKERNTKITADTGPAANSIAAIQRGIDNLHGKDLKVTVTETPGGYHITQAGGVGGTQTRATGGPIFGPGTGTSDTAGLFRLSNGEHVWTAKEVAKAGGHSAVKAMRNAVLSGDAPGLAAGGPAGIHVAIDDTRINAVMKSLNAAIHARAAFAPGAPGNVSANADMARRMVSTLGWTGAQWNALYALGMRESGWRNTAQNPTSTAYGIPQFLNSTWATVGMSKTSDPGSQIIGMERYIRQRYGTPINAWAHETKYGWYDDGGILPPGATLALNGTGKNETIRTHEQEGALQQRLRSREMSGRASSGAGGGSAPVNVNITGAAITGTVRIDGDGLAHIVDGRIESAFTDVTNRMHYNGGGH